MSEENQKFKVKIWSHRGANEYAPENTMEAFEKAVELGADGVELDVHQTADNEIVVIHDERLDRTSNGRGFVKNYTLNELRKFDYARDSKFKGQKHYEIPLLKEVFELLKPTDLSINIEMKTLVFHYPGIEAQILKMADDFGMIDRIWFSSFSRLTIEKIHLMRPEVKVGFLYNEPSVIMPSMAESLGLAALHPSFRNLRTPHFLEGCREYGILVNMWTIDTPEQMRACYEAGIHAIITNYPDKAREVFQAIESGAPAAAGLRPVIRDAAKAAAEAVDKAASAIRPLINQEAQKHE